MPMYIDAEVLKSRLEDFSRWCKDGRKEGVDFVLDCPLPDISTADVVEVVRCKDCKYFSKFHHCGVLGFCEPNEYCSRGERRKEDAEIH